jgi:hypothetical protein
MASIKPAPAPRRRAWLRISAAETLSEGAYAVLGKVDKLIDSPAKLRKALLYPKRMHEAGLGATLLKTKRYFETRGGNLFPLLAGSAG